MEVKNYRRYQTLEELRKGEIVDLGGIEVKMAEGELEPGDLYVAERNTGPQLLTVRSVIKEQNLVGGFVNPTTIDYSFDLCECVKVCEA